MRNLGLTIFVALAPTPTLGDATIGLDNPQGPPPPKTAALDLGSLAKLLTGKIKHIIVLMEENRSFDHLFGFSKLNVEKLKGNEYNLVNISNPFGPRVTVSDNAFNVNPCDPNHGTPGTLAKMGPGRDMSGFVNNENERGHGGTTRFCDVMSAFKPSKIPILTMLAAEFAIMDDFFCSHAGPTWPNRMYALSATSMGSTETSTWYEGIEGQMFPQRTIFDQVEEAGLKWRNYYNDTPWENWLEKLAHSPDNQVRHAPLHAMHHTPTHTLTCPPRTHHGAIA
jgi:phospholipase C